MLPVLAMPALAAWTAVEAAPRGTKDGLPSTDSASAGVPTLLGACESAAVRQLAVARGDGEAEMSSTLPFAALLLARCLDAASRPRDALPVLERAIAHSPTVLELYLAKAKCLKHLGEPRAAAAAAEAARQLDLADRHLNSKAVKYFLRCNDVEAAESLIALFARQDAKKPSADPLLSIRDVQVLWFELASGLALERRGDHGRALRRFVHVEGIFDAVFEDGFDYHSYCLRRATLRAYSGLLGQGEVLRASGYFLRAAMGAARVYAALSRDAAALEQARAQAKAAAEAAAALDAAAKEREKDGKATSEAAVTAAAATADASAKAAAAAAAAADAAGTPREAELAGAAQAAAAALSAAEEEEAAALREAAATGIDTDPEGSKLLAADALAEAWRHASLAAESLRPEHALLPRSAEARAQAAARRVAQLPAITSGVGALPDRRPAKAASIAVDVHALCAELAVDSARGDAAAEHLARALELCPAADVCGGCAARSSVREAAARVRARVAATGAPAAPALEKALVEAER
jgi:peptide alpha-N-acetyltransferase